MKRVLKRLIGVALLAPTAIMLQGSSHREALAILNEPCADNTDTYAWVSPGSHDKLYLIMDFNPLHEPGQGNQGLRACNGYRYEFHIGKGASLRDRVVYRVEFTNRIEQAPPPGPMDPVGGGNELLWQLTGCTETMKVTRIVHPERNDGDEASDGEEDSDRHARMVVLGDNLPVLPNNHGPQTDRLVPFRLTYEGRPLAGALVVAMNRLNPSEKLSARTDNQGRVRFRLKQTGMWLVKAVHMVPAPVESDAEWARYWASLTFELKQQ